MESEKVKKIKKALEFCVNSDCSNCIRTNLDPEDESECRLKLLKELLTLINELESENERLRKELDSEWKDRRKAEEDLHKAQWNYKIGLGQSQSKNAKLKDRIAELERENERLKRDYVVQAYEKLSERHNKLKRNFKNIEKFFKEKLKEKVNANNVDYFVESIKILENTIKEMLKENE